MQLVDEKHDVAGRRDLLEHRFEPLLEFAAELRARHQRAHIQGDHAAVLQALGHVGIDDPQGEPFDDGRLADARLADENRIVLRAARENLNHAADFLIAADDRIELSLPSTFDEVDTIFFQGLEFALGGLVGHALAAANRLHRLQDFLVGQGVQLENVLGLGIDLGQGEQEVFGGNELVFHRIGLALGSFQHSDEFVARLRRRSATDFRQPLQFAADDAIQLHAVRADFFQERRDNAFGFFEQGLKQMKRLDLRVALVGRKRLRLGDGLLAFDCQLFKLEWHDSSPLSLLASARVKVVYRSRTVL